MKYVSFFLITAILASAFIYSDAQKKKSSHRHKTKAGYGVTMVTNQPEFPGGADSLIAYIEKNLRYPRESKLKGEEGSVFIGFAIDSTGKLQNARVVNSVTAQLDSEALRVVQTMPDWKPGTIGTTPVKVEYILPVDFVLPKEVIKNK